MITPKDDATVEEALAAWKAGWTVQRGGCRYGSEHTAITICRDESHAWRILPKPEEEKIMDKLNASEALYGFVGWLTTRKEELTLSAHHDAGEPALLVDAFCKTNNLDGPRQGWDKNLKHPAEPAPKCWHCGRELARQIRGMQKKDSIETLRDAEWRYGCDPSCGVSGPWCASEQDAREAMEGRKA